MLTARQFKFGLHCDTGVVWADGPRLYTMRLLKKMVLNKEAASGFDRLRTSYGYSSPTLINGGWHLTSFGSMDELMRKLTSFGAANMFAHHADALDTHRLGACVKQVEPAPLSCT